MAALAAVPAFVATVDNSALLSNFAGYQTLEHSEVASRSRHVSLLSIFSASSPITLVDNGNHVCAITNWT
jgi:hypothetical protein